MRTLAAVSCLLLVACGTPPATSAPPAGRLHRPLGTWLHLEGQRATSGKVGNRTLLVDRVDGAPVDPPIAVDCDNLDLPIGERCAVAGYETGRWIGVPHEVLEREGLGPQQGAWQFHCTFVVTSVQGPESLVRTAREAGIGRR